MQWVDSSSGEVEEGVSAERDGEGDPLIPISPKWPTMLEWSATESEGEGLADGEDTRGGASLHLTVRCGAPRRVCGESKKKGTVALNKEGPGGAGGRSGQLGVLGVQRVPRVVAGDFDFAGTPDLCGQGERRGWGEPGERGRLEDPGQKNRRSLERLAKAHQQDERHGGVGLRTLLGSGAEARVLHPPAPLLPGGGVRAYLGFKRGCTRRARSTHRQTSIEEGELVEDGEEEIWWEQGGVGPANALSQSLQAFQDQPPARVRAWEEGQRVRRKAQERPPALPAGEEASVNMVSVAVEAVEAPGLGAMRLSKGVYVVDAGVGTEGTVAQEPVKGESGEQALGEGGTQGG
ncbi:hypothetical protein NDU88_006905 [Pleurodeles waltl]|uniref:Uncharacterized protein n=1 Tax=Pleurodeles waltl TaxID=8319 RepID=A0AAV7U1G4_PLEWA|nr:hypothetical protein NDU88_006905 [Pleurodeles waltl]